MKSVNFESLPEQLLRQLPLKIQLEVEAILETFGVRKVFLIDDLFSAQLENPPHPSVLIKRSEDSVFIKRRSALSGAIEQNIEMEFVILPTGNWLPVAFKGISRHSQEALHFADDGTFASFSPQTMESVIELSNAWAQKLETHQYRKARLVISP